MAGRMAMVFFVWGLVLVFAIAGGMQATRAELLAVCGAGLTLVARGFALAKQERRLAQAADDSQPLNPERERATV